MNRRFLLAASLSLVAGTVLLGVMRWRFQQHEGVDVTEEDVAEARLRLQGPSSTPPNSPPILDPSRTVRLVIGSLGWPDDERNRTLADLTTAALTGAKGLELVERQALNKILQELQLRLSGLVRAKDAVAVGKMLRADWFLLGGSVKLGPTNAIVVRIVDAHTGILRDAGVISADQTPVKTASDLAGFVRMSRETAGKALPRTYLAIGTFEDLSLNNRRADFSNQLRNYLVAGYRDSKVTLLERDYAEALLQEVQLDLAGLTDEAGSPPQPMQAAFWLVNGQYQSYETDKAEVEVLLDIHRMFGATKHIQLRGPPADPICSQVKTQIDAAIATAREILAPTRATEARAQMGIGKDIQAPFIQFRDFGLIYTGPGQEADPNNGQNWLAKRREHNLLEAVRTFQAVLLLEPTNREAKMRLAACLDDPALRRTNVARELYRELIESGVQDRWAEMARGALVGSFDREGSSGAIAWFSNAASETGNQSAAEFYREQAGAAAGRTGALLGDASNTEAAAEQQLFEGIREFKRIYLLDMPMTNITLNPSHSYCMGMYDFAKTLGEEKAKLGPMLAGLFPRMKAEAPDLEPYLLATVASFQADPKAPIAGEFERSLEACIEHPDKLLKPRKYWEYIRWRVCDWCFDNTNYDLAVRVLEGERRAAAEGHTDFGDEEKLKLGFAYLGKARWKEALAIFEAFSGQSVKAPAHNGPWGRAFTMVRTDLAVAYSRKQLDLVVSRDTRQFEMGPDCVCMHTPSAFLADEEGLWLAIGSQLMRLDLNLKTNLTIALPIDPETPIGCLSVGRDKIWIGTLGSGLFACDRANHACTRFQVADGLMMDSVSSLCEAGDRLWIGFGGPDGGGLGRLDLPSGKFKSYMASLIDNQARGTPNNPVVNLTLLDGRDLLMYAGGWIRRFSPGSESWGAISGARAGELLYTFAADQDWLVEGVTTVQVQIELETQPKNGPNSGSTVILSEEDAQLLMADIATNAQGRRITGNMPGKIPPKPGLEIHDVRHDRWQLLQDSDAMPNHASTVTIRQDQAWVGGEGYITCVDLRDRRVRKFARINAESVAHIQVAGGFLWAQYDRHLHRAAVQ